MRQRVKWATGQLVVRTGTVQDGINALVLYGNVAQAFPADKGRYEQFGILCSHTESSEGLGWSPEHMADSGLALQVDGYRAFLKMPEYIYDKWYEAVGLVSAAKDIDLAPVLETDDPNA